MKYNYFNKDINFSKKQDSFWERVYRKMFDFSYMLSTDLETDKSGIDRLIIEKNDNCIGVDEKLRRNDYSDVLLEFFSNNLNNTTTEGWIEKELCCDYIAYAFLSSSIVYFFDWLKLKTVWNINERKWLQYGLDKKEGFDIIIAKNTNYSTNSVAVPIRILKEIMKVDVIQL